MPDAVNFRLMLSNHGNPAKAKTITKEDSSQTGRISTIMPLKNSQLINCWNQNYHKLLNFTSQDVTAHLSQVIMPQRWCVRYNTPNDGKEISTHLEECVYPTYDHQNLFYSTLILSAQYPQLKFIYQCERLNSSLLKKVKM